MTDKIKLEQDEKKGKVVLHVQSQLDGVLEANCEDRKTIDASEAKRLARKGKMHRVGRIPLRAFLALSPQKQQRLLTDDKYMRKWLKKHPEYMTTTARIR